MSAAALAASAIFAMHPAPAAAPPGGAGGGGAGTHLTYSVPAGRAVSGAVVVSNLTDRPLLLALYGADLIPLGTSGGYTVAQLGQQNHYVGAWIRVQPSVSVAPRHEATVPFSVDVPADERPGSYGGAVVAQNAPRGGAGIAVQTRVALEVVLRVPGASVVGAQLGPLRTRTSGGRVVMSTTLRNTGTERFRFQGQVLLQRGGSSLLLRLPMRPGGTYLLPGQEVQLSGTWRHPPRFGSVTAHASVRAEPAEGAAQTFNDAAVKLAFFPWLLVLLALLALVLLVAVARRAWRYWAAAVSDSTSARAKPSYPLLPTV